MLIRTRFANVPQLHRVAGPMMDRRQITFEAEPVGGSWAPSGDVLVVQKDLGGNEFFQLHRLDTGRLTLLTDGKSRNQAGAWSKDGRLIAYSSTRRNGTDTDLYVMDPRDPKTDRMVAQVRAAVGPSRPSPGQQPCTGAQLQAGHQQRSLSARPRHPPADAPSATTRRMSHLAAPSSRPTASSGSCRTRPATCSASAGWTRRRAASHPVANAGRWDIEEFDISEDGRTIAYFTNEAGISRLYLLDVASSRSTRVDALPVGVAGGLEWSPWGELGFTFNSARGPADAWSLNPATGKLTRWTQSETGGLDFSGNPEAQLVEVRSFDGERVSGFLYRPDPPSSRASVRSSSTSMAALKRRSARASRAATIT
jgi:dipeptidyl aminopeptidase/acylaminoacyl peptidase